MTVTLPQIITQRIPIKYTLYTQEMRHKHLLMKDGFRKKEKQNCFYSILAFGNRNKKEIGESVARIT